MVKFINHIIQNFHIFIGLYSLSNYSLRSELKSLSYGLSTAPSGLVNFSCIILFRDKTSCSKTVLNLKMELKTILKFFSCLFFQVLGNQYLTSELQMQARLYIWWHYSITLQQKRTKFFKNIFIFLMFSYLKSTSILTKYI